MTQGRRGMSDFWMSFFARAEGCLYAEKFDAFGKC